MGLWKTVKTDLELGIPVPRHVLEAGTLAHRNVPNPMPLFPAPPRPTPSPEHHNPQEHPPMSTAAKKSAPSTSQAEDTKADIHPAIAAARARRAVLVEAKATKPAPAPEPAPRTRPKDEPAVEVRPAKVETPPPAPAPGTPAPKAAPPAPTPEPVDPMAVVDAHNQAKRAKQDGEAAAYYAARGKTPDGHPIATTAPGPAAPMSQSAAIAASDLGAPTAMRIAAAVETLRECRGAVELIIRTLKGIAANRWPCANPEADANVADRFEALLSDKGDGLKWAMTDLDDIIADMAPGSEQGEWARAILEVRPASKGGRARTVVEREPGEDDLPIAKALEAEEDEDEE